MSSSAVLLFVIVGKNEPLYEAEIDASSSLAPSNTASGGAVGTGSPSQQQQQQQHNELATRQNYFVLHSALDLVEKSVYATSNMYLRVVDKVNQQQVSTFVTAANIKFMLLHGGKGEEVIKNFFSEVYGYYVKVYAHEDDILCFVSLSYGENPIIFDALQSNSLISLSSRFSGVCPIQLSMNPFYKYDTPIMSKAFDARVRAAARAYLS